MPVERTCDGNSSQTNAQYEPWNRPSDAIRQHCTKISTGKVGWLVNSANSGYEITRLSTVDATIGFLRPSASEMKPDANVATIYAIAAQHDAITLLANGMSSVFVA